MGYALWTNGQVALAQGKHEYRPYGQAFIAASDLFRERHFQRGRQFVPPGFQFQGYFASLSDVNHHLWSARQKKSKTGKPPRSQFVF